MPNDVPVALRAAARGLTGPPLEIQLNQRSVAVLRLSLDLTDSASRAATGTLPEHGSAQLKGRVTREDASPVAEAQVLVVGLPGATRSTASGAFELADLPAGTYTLEVRAIGFQRRRRLIDLRPGRVTEVSLALQSRAAELPEIKVVGKPARGVAEFDEHRTKGMGGYFMDQDQIEKRNAVRTEDLFRTVPGLRVLPLNGFDSQIVSSRGVGFNGACSPDFYVDGVWIAMDPETTGGLPSQQTSDDATRGALITVGYTVGV